MVIFAITGLGLLSIFILALKFRKKAAPIFPAREERRDTTNWVVKLEHKIEDKLISPEEALWVLELNHTGSPPCTRLRHRRPTLAQQQQNTAALAYLKASLTQPDPITGQVRYK